MKNFLLFLLISCSFLSANAQTYGDKIVARGLSQQGHWVYDSTLNTTFLAYDSVYYVDINWKIAIRATGALRMVLGITGGAIGATTAYFWADATAGGATVFSSIGEPAILAIGAMIGVVNAEDCRWNNVKEIPKDEYIYDKAHYGSLAPFYAKHPLIL